MIGIAMDKAQLVSIRNYVPEDRNFILATFLRGLYYGESWFSIIQKDAFMQHYHKVIEFILAKPETEIKVACLKDDPNVILGYSVFERNRLHWIFVKKPWRNIGIARDLAPKEFDTVTHLTKVGLSIIKNRKVEFNPFVI